MVGINITSHLSNLDEDQVKKIDDYFAKMNMLKVADAEPVKVHNKKDKKDEKPIRKIIDEDEEDDEDILESPHAQKSKKNKNLKNKKNNNISFEEGAVKIRIRRKKEEGQILF